MGTMFFRDPQARSKVQAGNHCLPGVADTIVKHKGGEPSLNNVKHKSSNNTHTLMYMAVQKVRIPTSTSSIHISYLHG